MTKQIAVLLSGRGSNFESLLKASRDGSLGGDIGLVISNRPEGGGLQIAQDAGIDTALIDHQKYPSREAFDRDLAGVVESISPDLVVLAGFMRIIKRPMLDAWPRRILNIHPSLLPSYPGLRAWQQALDAGDTETGCTVHLVDEIYDHGPVIHQRTCPVEPGDTRETLAARVFAEECRAFPEVVAAVAEGRLRLEDGMVLGSVRGEC